MSALQASHLEARLSKLELELGHGVRERLASCAEMPQKFMHFFVAFSLPEGILDLPDRDLRNCSHLLFNEFIHFFFPDQLFLVKGGEHLLLRLELLLHVLGLSGHLLADT